MAEKIDSRPEYKLSRQPPAAVSFGSFALDGVRAVFFDMDGTLIDSTLAIERTWSKWSRRTGIGLERILPTAHGRSVESTVRTLAPTLDSDVECDWFLRRELEDADGVVPVPGARDFVFSLNQFLIPWAVVTAAPEVLARFRLRLCGIPVPRVLVPFERMKFDRPEAAGYSIAIREIGVEPESCLAVEDTPIGLQAARSCGLKTLAIATTFGPEDLATPEWIGDFRDLRTSADESGLKIEKRI